MKVQSVPTAVSETEQLRIARMGCSETQGGGGEFGCPLHPQVMGGEGAIHGSVIRAALVQAGDCWARGDSPAMRRTLLGLLLTLDADQ